MEIKYFGINNAVIDSRFNSANDICNLLIKNKEKILSSYLNPVLDNNDNEYKPQRVELDNNLFLDNIDIYNYGIVYTISNIGNNENKIKTSSKLIIGHNNVSFFIDDLDGNHNNNLNLIKSLKENIEKEKIFTDALEREINIKKLYGKRSNNKLIKKLENTQINLEKEIVSNAINNSINFLENTNEKEKILPKTRS